MATQSAQARELRQRIDLARDIHEEVIQRLFGVSMALDGEGDLPAEARERCATETQNALHELRTGPAAAPGSRAPSHAHDADRRGPAPGHRAPELGIMLESGAPGDVPTALEPLAQSVLTEAVRNAQKHARPTRVAVRVTRGDGTFGLEVINDGVAGGRRRAGMGLRLAALEALQSGGVVEFGERGPGRWQVRLVVPDGSGDGE